MRILSPSAGVVLVLVFAGAFAGHGSWWHRPYDWSLYLGQKEYKGGFLQDQLAASNSAVAINHEGAVLFFGAKHGHSRHACHPTPGRTFGLISSNGVGNFLAVSSPLTPSGRRSGSDLIEISDTCRILKRVRLSGFQPSPEDQGTGGTALSPSRRTLVFYWNGKTSVAYRVFDAETLRLRGQWFEPRTGDMEISGVSDQRLLGTVPMQAHPNQPPQARQPLWYRPFGGRWKQLPFTFPFYGQASFLSNDAVICAGMLDPLGGLGEKATPSVIRIYALDGTIRFTAVANGFWFAVSPNMPISTAADGRHFGIHFDFSGNGPLWGPLDMGPEHFTSYIWSTARPKWKKRFGASLFGGWPAFPPDGKWVVSLDKRELTVRPLAH